MTMLNPNGPRFNWQTFVQWGMGIIILVLIGWVTDQSSRLRALEYSDGILYEKDKSNVMVVDKIDRDLEKIKDDVQVIRGIVISLEAKQQ